MKDILFNEEKQLRKLNFDLWAEESWMDAIVKTLHVTIDKSIVEYKEHLKRALDIQRQIIELEVELEIRKEISSNHKKEES